MRKIYIYSVLLFIAFLNIGCSIMGIDLTENRTIAIQKNPFVIIADGDIEQRDLDHIEKMITMLSAQPYIKADNSNFQVHITDQTVVSKGTKLNETIKESNSESIMINPQAVRE